MHGSIRLVTFGWLCVAALLLSACATSGGGDPLAQPSGAPASDTVTTSEPAGSEPADAAGGTVVVGSANFPEQLILANMYADVLEDAGVTVERRLNLGSREVIFPALESGEIDLLPEYLGALHAFLGEGEEEPITDTQELRSALEEELPEGIVLLESSAAQDQDALAVTKETAEKFDLQTVSDLAPVADMLTLGGPAETAERYVGVPGLKEVYGVEFGEFRALDAGGPLTTEALNSGQIDVGRVFSTQGVIAANDWVVLEEDKPLVPSENITPVIREEVLTDEIRAALNELSATLTTEELTALNRRVEVDKDDPDQVARDYLTEKGLIGG